MARNCSPTPQVNLFPLLLRALSSNISSTLQTPFLLQSDPKSLHQLWWLYWKGSSPKSISHTQLLLQKHLVCTATILRRRVQRARAPLPLMPNFPQSLTQSSAIHLTYIFTQPTLYTFAHPQMLTPFFLSSWYPYTASSILDPILFRPSIQSFLSSKLVRSQPHSLKHQTILRFLTFKRRSSEGSCTLHASKLFLQPNRKLTPSSTICFGFLNISCRAVHIKLKSWGISFFILKETFSKYA